MSFDPADLRDVRARLHDMLSSLEVRMLEAKKQSLDNLFIGGVDGAIDEITFMAVDAEMYLIRRIRDALRRIESGEYGLCKDCGEMIAVARLLAVPFAAKCFQCQQFEEQPIVNDAVKSLRWIGPMLPWVD
jgi:DnaK suppressor protein